MNKLKQIIKQITDNDLNTTPGLTTINYLFELIGLKDKVDLRKFSRNFIKIDELIKNTNNEKEDKIIKNDAFNKNFGTNKGEILEGHRMAQILGVEDFGGDVQISGVKKVGYSYWCTANKEMYKCKVENSLNYIDEAYFDAFSNSALLGKLQNLSYVYEFINEIHVFKYSDGRLLMFCNKSVLPGQSLSVGIDYVLGFNLPVKFIKKFSQDINKDISFLVSHYGSIGNVLTSCWYKYPNYQEDVRITVRLVSKSENDCPLYIRLEGWWK